MSLKKKTGKLLSGIMAAVLLMQSMALGMPTVSAAQTDGDEPVVQATGTEYYFSAVGTATGEGTGTQADPYRSLEKIKTLDIKPGDKLLLQRGSEFNDQYIHLENKGDATGEPIIIEPYGEGDRPKINTNGKGEWQQDYRGDLDNPLHKRAGTVSSAILLKDTENIQIRGLEITNQSTLTDAELKDANRMDRTGVAGMAQNKGTLEDIVLDDLYIHDITGNIINKHMLNGGIYFICALPDKVATNNNDIQDADIPKFDGLTIQNCHIENVYRWGIAVAYTIYWNKFTAKVISDELAQKFGSSNVVIKNNYLKDIGGDAITTMYCYKPLVQANVSQGAAMYISNEMFGTNGHKVAAGIWPWKCKDSIFERNECFDMKNYLTGNQDAQAWDADFGDGTIYQYNYSHGNSGGCIMVCGGQAYRTTFRYNISQNDERGMLCVPGNPDLHAYNNTFYIKEGVPIIASDFRNGAAHIENNIFYYTGSEPKQENYNPASRTDVIYANNLYYNYANENELDATGIFIEAGEVIFVDPGKAPTASQSTGKAHELSVFEGYKLAANSPAIGAGKTITDDNGYTLPTKDFFNVDLDNTLEIGAAAYTEMALQLASVKYQIVTGGGEEGNTNTISGLPANTTLEAFKDNVAYPTDATLTVKNADGSAVAAGGTVKYPMTVELTKGTEKITYTIIPDTDATLHSTLFKVDETNNIYVPSTAKNPCTIDKLKESIEVASTATVSITDGTGEVTGPIEDGMTLKITAEDTQTVTEYTIKLQNEYHWIKDYVDAQQGNVWFAQYTEGEGDYQNYSNYSSQYAVWTTGAEGYMEVGAEGTKGSVTETTNGLIVDFTSNDKYPYMTFRAPMDGVVSFKLRDTEPYLRQNGNSGGSARLDLFLNDEAEPRQTSGEMSVSRQKADFATVEIAVRKGDFIRLKATATGSPSRPSIHATPIITYLDKEVDTTAPTAPTNARASEVTSNSAKLQWTAATDEVGVYRYEIYDGETLLASVAGTATEAVLTGLRGATEYKLDIYALDAFRNKSEAAPVSFTTLENLDELKQQLTDKIAEAQAKIAEGKYTDETVAALEEEITASNELLEGTDLTRAALEQAIADLDAAITALKDIPPVIDETEELKITLSNLYVAAEKQIAEGDYTEESVAKVEEEVTKARALVLKPDATKEELEQAISDLDAAVKALVENGTPPAPDDTSELKTKLRDLVSQAQAKTAEGKYTEETVAKVEQEVAKAKSLLGQQSPTKAALEKSITDLTAAVNALKEKETKPGPDPGPSVQTVAAPAFNPVAGTYPDDQKIAISSATEGAAIYYTINGADPTTSSTKYTEPISINRRVVIRAIAVKDGMTNSQVAKAAYLMDRPFPFTDVEQNGQWKHNSVKYVWDNSIMNGISGTTNFDPDSPLTRAMFATVLYRMAGEPAIQFTDRFSDVEAGKWYSNAIIWANQEGIVQGMGDGSYGINNNITREQIAKMLFEYAKGTGYDISEAQELSEFTDEDDVSGWAVGYMKWATAVKMITGKPNTDNKTFRMDPKGEATRAECAAMLMRFEDKYIPYE